MFHIMGCSNFPHPSQHLLLSASFVVALLVSVNWYLTVLICISLMTNDLDHIFIWVNVYIHLKIRLLVFIVEL